jgi:hypothetical protein
LRKTERVDAAILVLERVGLLDAFLDMAGVLDTDGQDKYGDQGWRNKPEFYHVNKCSGHVEQQGLDHESSREHASHAAARALMVSQMRIERR